MAIVKNGGLRASRLDGVGGGESSPESRDSVSVDGSDDSSGELSADSSSSSAGGVESDSDSDGADSGLGSDSLDLSELGEPGTELCQVGNHSVSLPLELYDLPDLTAILNLDVWNNLLSEDDRFALSEFLPDMDQETFTQTLKELFLEKNFHFGNPLSDMFTKLKAGALDPRVVLYRKGLNSFKKREHYHLLRKYQNSMVGSLGKIREAWKDSSGYGIEERLRLLNILRSRRSLGYDEESVGSETDSENSAEDLWGQRQPVGFRKDNVKGILKVTPPQKASARKQYPLLTKHGIEKKSKASKGLLGYPRHYDDGDDDEEEEEMEDQGYEMEARARMLKPGKELLKKYGGDDEGYAGMVPYDGKGRNVDQGVTIASYNPHSLETMSKARYSGKDWMYPPKEQLQHQLKGAHVDWSAGSQQLKSEEWNIRGKKLKSGDDFRTGISKAGSDLKAKSYKAYPAQMGDQYLYSDRGGKITQAKIKTKSPHDGRTGMGFPRGRSAFAHSEETESDSSDQVEENGDAYPFAKKVGYPSGAMDDQHPGVGKSAYDLKMNSKFGKVDKNVYSNILTPEMKPYSTKAKQKSKTTEPSYLQDVVAVKRGQALRPSEKVQSSTKASATDRKRKGAIVLDQFAEHNSLCDYGSGKMNDNEDYLDGNTQFLDTPMQANRSGSRYQVADADRIERSNMSMLVCNSVSKKRKGKADSINQNDMEEAVYLQASPVQQIDEPNFIKKKVKKKADVAASPLSVATPDSIIPEKGSADVESEKPQKKPFTLIIPTKQTGFSFSIIHLLSAVRKAMVTSHAEDGAEIGNRLEKGVSGLKQMNEENKILQAVNGTHLLNMDMNASSEAGQDNLPSLTVQEIVNRVRTNPGDPCILETQEPLQDLVRGVLKIFSSKTAPLGAKGWKALVSYEKSNKSWCWVGPLSSSSPDMDNVEEETSAEAWNIPHKMLVKLVDAFANWLKSGQETLQQIGSLPAPPIALLPHLDEKERFRDLRAQKSLNTIGPSSEEVRAYFRKEELLRYLIPDRAFSYTAADGKKSIVAPLRRGGGKPTSKARDHFMLKPDRPPHVTILCLVRDAAARLPGSIGTRADVCTLIRDSQYIVEDVTDPQVNQVVSGALDRLHYERDPCVLFDADRKLWVYLHRDREEEDFEDDGTSSTKKWKRQRKDAADQSDTGPANDVSCHATGDSAGGGSARYDFNPDLNVDASSMQAGMNAEPIYNDLRSNMDPFQSFINPPVGDRSQGDSTGWDALGLTPLRDNKMICQENSTNEDFEDESFGRERQGGILSASLS